MTARGGATTGAPYDVLAARPDRSSPFVTGYDGPVQCTELSVASALNAVAKAGGLLRDELGLAPGDRLSVDLPLHWQLPVWTLASLSVGLVCGYRLTGPVAARLLGPDGLDGLSRGADPRADEVLGCACDALGLPVPGGVPAGVVDVGVSARAHPDVLAVDPGATSSAALVTPDTTLSWVELLAAGSSEPAGLRTWVGDGVTPTGLLLRRCAVDPLLRAGSVVVARGVPADEAARLAQLQRAVLDDPGGQG